MYILYKHLRIAIKPVLKNLNYSFNADTLPNVKEYVL